jgi:hypothetical protein
MNGYVSKKKLDACGVAQAFRLFYADAAAQIVAMRSRDFTSP